MGNRSYLNVQPDIQLFEANNSLPFFWLMGLLPQDYSHMQKAIEDNRTDINIYNAPIRTYLHQAQHNTAYIESVYPLLKTLYNQFLQVLTDEATQHPDANIEIEYSEYLSFYESLSEFYGEIIKFGNELNNNEKNIFFFEGDVLGAAIGSDEYSNHAGQAIFTDASYKKTNDTLIKEFNQALKGTTQKPKKSLWNSFLNLFK